MTAFTIPGTTPPPPTPNVWDVYVHAHQDDWQLWESPDSYNHYQAGDHLLFIYTTAGDAGQNISRWGAREQGAEASVRYIVGAGAAEGSGSVNFCYTALQQVCHSIWTWTYGNTVSVFMRVPDGGNHGPFGPIGLGPAVCREFRCSPVSTPTIEPHWGDRSGNAVGDTWGRWRHRERK